MTESLKENLDVLKQDLEKAKIAYAEAQNHRRAEGAELECLQQALTIMPFSEPAENLPYTELTDRFRTLYQRIERYWPARVQMRCYYVQEAKVSVSKTELRVFEWKARLKRAEMAHKANTYGLDRARVAYHNEYTGARNERRLEIRHMELVQCEFQAERSKQRLKVLRE